MMEVAHREPIAVHGLERQAGRRFIPAPVRPERHQHCVVQAVRGGFHFGDGYREDRLG